MAKITLNHITKIEGHASLNLKIENHKVVLCELQAVEGSRHFEGLLKNRMFDEAQEISSRICGICSCAHTAAALLAMENALGIVPSKQTQLLRELLTLGERIRSHTTHLYFLILPDFLGYESALDMAPKYSKEVKRALKLMKLGNEMITAVTGRDLHPASAAVGGFRKLPKQEQIDEFAKKLKEYLPDAVETAKLFLKLKYPKFDSETEYFSLAQPAGYAALGGDLVSEHSVFKQKDYFQHLREYHEPYSTSNFVVKEGKSYMVGALARLNNNNSEVKGRAKELIKGLEFPITNPFKISIAQAIELVMHVERAAEICKELKIRPEELPVITPKACQGTAAVEAPRGILFHEYRLDKRGDIIYANIITPTCQNLRNLQDDITKYLNQVLLPKKLSKELIIIRIEELIRAYDPCFSCSTHFLEVNWL